MTVWEAIRLGAKVMDSEAACQTDHGERKGVVKAVRSGEPAVLLYWLQGGSAWCHSQDVHLQALEPAVGDEC